jgi:hypothetical protein
MSHATLVLSWFFDGNRQRDNLIQRIDRPGILW